jgi:RNA polymerase sigma-70 factor (ECF subfamily)
VRDADRARDVLWLEPLPVDLYADAHADPAAAYDLRESVSLAFLTALQALAPRQRAVLIMRDVLAVSAKETAETLEISVSSVNSLLHRARQKLRGQYSRPSAGTYDPQAADLLRRYVGAWEAGDIEALMGLLKAGTTLEMPPIRSAVIGVEAIRRFLGPAILDGTPGRWRALITEANGSAAIALYERATSDYGFTGLQLINTDGRRIATITAYMDATLAAGFHLPREITG